ncbi:MAG: hypothetical protein J6X50_01405 [Bacilli bacterium]|nr:hypothetical protein [Bacilli bacterium]
MKTNNRLLFLLPLVSLILTGCNQPTPKSSSPKSEPTPVSSEPEPEDDGTATVFVLSGQSNMEGSTTYVSDQGDQWLRNAFEKLNDEYDLDLDISYFEDDEGNVNKNAPGVPEVLTSYYGFYPPSGPNAAHASNSEDKLAGKFMPTNVAMGSQERFMGPEIGMSMVLKEYASEDNPIYFIKCAFSGSGFTNSAPNWAHDSTFNGYNATNNLYETYFAPFVTNNLKLIEDESGRTPVIKGFLWHQGESDAGSNNYKNHLGSLVERFRTDYEDYAPDQDGQNIAFIDGYIYDGPRSPYGADSDLVVNQQKDLLAQEKENNYVINTSYHHEDGQEKMCLNINPDRGDVEGGVDNYHYKTVDCVRLGMAYAQMIIDNDIL